MFAWNALGAQRVKAQVIDFSGGFVGAGDILTANGMNGRPYFPAYSFYTLARLTTGHGSQAASLFSNDRVPGPPPPNAIAKSVCIKFDTFDNRGETDNSAGLFSDGRSPTIAEPGTDDRNDPIDEAVLDLKSQHPFRVDMAYDGTTLTVTITDTVTEGSVTNMYLVDISSHVGGNTAYVGFSGGTGSTTAVQDIESWTFQSGM